jgi:CRP/FNR family cyclic AMP-dependent transcriptional regulator
MTRDLQRIDAVFAAAAPFARLNGGERRRLAQKATTRVYPTGATIIREGDTSMTLYVVLSGRVGIDASAEGGPRRLREIGPTGFFGELGLIDDSPRSASVVAMQPTECALLSAWDIRDHGGVALGLLPILAERLRENNARATSDSEWLASLEGA